MSGMSVVAQGVPEMVMVMVEWFHWKKREIDSHKLKSLSK